MVNLQSCLRLIFFDCHTFMCATLLYWWWKNTSIVTQNLTLPRIMEKSQDLCGSCRLLQSYWPLLSTVLHTSTMGFFLTSFISCIRATSWGVTSRALIKSSTLISLMSLWSLCTALATRSSVVKEDQKSLCLCCSWLQNRPAPVTMPTWAAKL